MFKKFKKNDNYLAVAIYAFLVIAASICLIWLLVNASTIWGWIKGVIYAMLPFVYGFIIAYICNPIYKKLYKSVFKFVDKKKPRPKLRKLLSIFVTYLIFVLIISLLLLTIIPSIVSSLDSLGSHVKEYIDNFNTWLDGVKNDLNEAFPSINENDSTHFLDKFFSFSSDGGMLQTVVNFLTDNITGFVSTLVSQIFSIIVGFILSIYFLIYKDNIAAKLKRVICAFFKETTFKRIVDFFRYTDSTLGRYMLGVIVDSAIVGIVMFIVLTIFRFDFALLIAVTCGVTNIIPFFGPFIGAIPSGILIFISTGDPVKVLIFAIIVLVLQQIDGNIIAPHIQGNATGLTPIGVIAAVTFASHVFGFVGMVVGVPICAVIAFYVDLYIKKRLTKKRMPAQVEYYRVKDVYEDENFSKARFALEAEGELNKSETIATAAIKEEVLQEIKEQVVEKVMHKALDGINEEAEAKVKDGEV